MNQLQEEASRIASTAVVRIVGAITLAYGDRPNPELIDRIRRAVIDAGALFALAGVSAMDRVKTQSALARALAKRTDDDAETRPTQPSMPRVAVPKKVPPPPPPPRK